MCYAIVVHSVVILFLIYFSPLISSLVPAAIPNIPYRLQFIQGQGDAQEDLINYEFTSHDLVCLACCSLVGAWYLVQKVGIN